MRGISTNRSFNLSDAIQAGYIIIPSNFEGKDNRDKYVSRCYKCERVSILPERGGTPLHDCYITKEALKNIEFPKDVDLLGTAILFFTTKHSGQAVVIGTLSKLNETGLEDEENFKIFEVHGCNTILAQFDAKESQILIQNIGATKSPKIKINVSNENKDGLFSLNVGGDINIDLSGEIKIKSRKKFNLKVNDTEIEVDGKVRVKNEQESLKSLIDDLISEITKITVPTGVGPSGIPINIAQFELLKERMGNLLKD